MAPGRKAIKADSKDIRILGRSIAHPSSSPHLPSIFIFSVCQRTTAFASSDSVGNVGRKGRRKREGGGEEGGEGKRGKRGSRFLGRRGKKTAMRCEIFGTFPYTFAYPIHPSPSFIISMEFLLADT